MPFVDLHNHILPGVDDGSPSLSCSLDVARRAVEEGIDTIVCTPHVMPPEYDNRRDDIHQRTSSLQQELDRQGIALTLIPGGEIYYSLDIPEKFFQGEIPALGKSHYLLLEFPMQEIPASSSDLLFNLQLKGVKVLLAHPERNREIARNPRKARDLVARDVRLLMNSGSLLGMYGSEIKEAANWMLKDGLIAAIATDSHRNPDHMGSLKKAWDLVKDIMGEECCEQLFDLNPRAILGGKTVIPVRRPGTEKSFQEGRPSAGRERGILGRFMDWFSGK